MAAALVGGAFLSAALQVLFQKLASREVLDFFRGRKFSDALLRKLNMKLMAINCVLNDAEEKQITNILVKAWLDELKDAVFVADDLLDEIATVALRCKLEAVSDAISDDQVHNVSSTSLISFDEGMQSKIEEILDRLEYSSQQIDVLRLQVVEGGKLSQRLPTTSLVDESIVYGRDHDKEKVIEFLLSDTDASSGHEIGIFTIVGMGGVGKTTLAQLVYNDSKVQGFFDLKPWVCVSEEFDVLRVTKTILEAINPSACDTNDLNLLQVRLKESLSKKKFLLILDDVWNENSENWVTLRAPFRFGAKGSKIIVTTRSENVATIMGSDPTYHLNELLDEDCWSIFAKCAFNNNNSKKLQELEVIGRKIVRKCKGLPLAVRTLGGLLRSKADVAYWYRILKSKLWELPNDKNNILPALNLSYHYLPSHLKCCFAYCSIIPKDYEIAKQQLVLLWMAQDFLHDPHGNKQMEEVGNEYFDNLISRSFFQQSRKDKSRFVMHDLINDLAKYVSGEFCFRLEDEILSKISDKTRHFSYSINEFDASRKFKALNIAKNLRTFLPCVVRTHYHFCLADCVPQDILLAQSFLRVLSLSHYRNIRELPNSLGGLNHLRYLDLSYTAIRKLPDSTSKLCNLQTLLLHDCPDLTELPPNMGNLINLRHFDVSGTKLKEMPMHMSKITNLQTLSTFIVGEHEGSKIKELRDLNDLHGRLEILNLENVVNARDAQEGNLKEKVHIEELRLQWSIEAEDSQTARDVLDKLQPQTNLKELTIERYGGTRFPDWLGDESFSNMVSLCLSKCKYCLTLPPVGRLTSLRGLLIKGFDEVVKIGSELYGRDTCAVVNNKPFEYLEYLRIENMPELEEWCCSADEGAEFGCLKGLGIVNCPKLKGVLPDHLPFLKTLDLLNCGNLELFSSNGVVNVPKLDSWPHLEVLVISNMSELKELPPGLMLSLPAIEELSIKSCLSLESLPMSDLPTTLKSLRIVQCPKLDLLLPEEEADDDEEEIQQMAHYYSDASLQDLTIIESCDPLASFPLGLFPKLRKLYLSNCRHLKSLWIPKGGGGGGVHGDNPLSVSSLSELSIVGCPKLESFPKGGLPAPNLTYFAVQNGASLKSLPEGMHDLLPSLEHLAVSNCPELESFPEGGLPTSLTSLMIWYCHKLTDRRTEWGLQKRLPNLNSFHISGVVVEEESSFPEEWLLPSSLTSLTITRLPNLKYLNQRGIQHLTSLQQLYISGCSKLQCLPLEGLPHSLSSLKISLCPQLEKWCEREKGQGWPKIAHIPNILINFDKLIS